jgi:pimeloyl-ACP methyl ester carboxylesterase
MRREDFQRAYMGEWEVAVTLERPAEQTRQYPFVLAHGKYFDSSVWLADGEFIDRMSKVRQRTGVQAALAAAGHQTYAFEIPGHESFPNTRSIGPELTDPSTFYETFLGRLGVGPVIGVFPSQSGPNVAFPVLRQNPGVLAGVVLVAPVETGDFSAGLGQWDEVPTLVVWAKDDPVASPDQAELVAGQSSRAAIAMFEDGGHAPYLEHPTEFADALAWFGEDPVSAADRLADFPAAPGLQAYARAA